MLANNLKHLRIKEGISQDKLCKHLDICLSTYTKLERGIVKNPNLGFLKDVSNYYNVTIDDMLKKSLTP
jgi:transcriptional regulator with XRE-family HTH domain